MEKQFKTYTPDVKEKEGETIPVEIVDNIWGPAGIMHRSLKLPRVSKSRVATN